MSKLSTFQRTTQDALGRNLTPCQSKGYINPIGKKTHKTLFQGQSTRAMSNCRKEVFKINSIILKTEKQPDTQLTQDASAPQLTQVNIIPKQADNDQELIKLWLHGKSKHTQRYYKSDVKQFFNFTNKLLRQVILKDLQNFADHIDQQELVDGSKRRILSSIKSLISFSHKLGYLPYDISRPLILPSPKDTLAERILSSDEVRSKTSSPSYSIPQNLNC